MSAFGQAQKVPYPVENAAVHHVFNGGWAMSVEIQQWHHERRSRSERNTSEVIAVERGARRLGLLDGSAAVIGEAVFGSTPVNDFVIARTLSFSTGDIVGKRWALLPSAAGFGSIAIDRFPADAAWHPALGKLLG